MLSRLTGKWLVFRWWLFFLLFCYQSSAHTHPQLQEETAQSLPSLSLSLEMILQMAALFNTGGAKPTPSLSIWSFCCCHYSACAPPPSSQGSPSWVKENDDDDDIWNSVRVYEDSKGVSPECLFNSWCLETVNRAVKNYMWPGECHSEALIFFFRSSCRVQKQQKS